MDILSIIRAQFDRVQERAQIRRALKALAELDDHLLRDIGLDRDTAETLLREGPKPHVRQKATRRATLAAAA